METEGAPFTEGETLTRPIENLTKRKSTGGRSRAGRGRRAYERDGYALEPLVGAVSQRASRVRGGEVKFGLVFADFANVSDSSGKTTKSKILRVKSSGAKRDYERRGVITLGAVVETEAGEAVVTSRPSDDGVVNAALTSKK